MRVKKTGKMRCIAERWIDRTAGWAGRCYGKTVRMMNNVRNEELGASELVVLVALIVIVLAVVVIFRTQLSTIVKTVGSKVVKWINAN